LRRRDFTVIGGGRVIREWCCVLYDGERCVVAEVRPSPKEVVGTDVFRLVVHPDVVSLAMAVVVALEQMFARPSLLRSWCTA
jgi:hypothetical protein